MFALLRICCFACLASAAVLVWDGRLSPLAGAAFVGLVLAALVLVIALRIAAFWVLHLSGELNRQDLAFHIRRDLRRLLFLDK